MPTDSEEVTGTLKAGAFGCCVEPSLGAVSTYLMSAGFATPEQQMSIVCTGQVQ
jgi:hypothetical protein